MQPLPPDIITSVFDRAYTGFRSAAAQLGTPASAKLLQQAAHDTYQGIPSLRMTAPRDLVGQLCTRLDDAAAAANVLAKQIAAAPDPARYAGQVDVVTGWARLVDNAAGAIRPMPVTG